jgi:hypothetical protein
MILQVLGQTGSKWQNVLISKLIMCDSNSQIIW